MLNQAELSVSIDKQSSQIDALRSAKDDPLLFAVLVDVSKSDAASADAIKQAALQLFDGLATGQNRGYLVLFNELVAVSKQPLTPFQAKQALEEVRFNGGTAVYDAIEQTCSQALNRVANTDNPRRIIVLISDGEDNSSHVTHTKAEEAAQEEGVAVFSVATHSSLAGPHGEKFLKELSESTGALSTNKNLQQAVPLALSAIEAQWVVSLTPSQSGRKALHSVRVKSSQKNIQFSAPANISFP